MRDRSLSGISPHHEDRHLLGGMVLCFRVRYSFAFRFPLPRQLLRFGDLVRVHLFGERIP
jgi:hypothetical protein